jgi:HEAT repeat protein
VRKRTIVLLGNLEPQVLSNYAQHIIPRLFDEDSSVCNTAIEALGKLEPQVLASYAQDIIELLDDED